MAFATSNGFLDPALDRERQQEHLDNSHRVLSQAIVAIRNTQKLIKHSRERLKASNLLLEETTYKEEALSRSRASL